MRLRQNLLPPVENPHLNRRRRRRQQLPSIPLLPNLRPRLLRQPSLRLLQRRPVLLLRRHPLRRGLSLSTTIW